MVMLVLTVVLSLYIYLHIYLIYICSNGGCPISRCVYVDFHTLTNKFCPQRKEQKQLIQGRDNA